MLKNASQESDSLKEESEVNPTGINHVVNVNERVLMRVDDKRQAGTMFGLGW